MDECDVASRDRAVVSRVTMAVVAWTVRVTHAEFKQGSIAMYALVDILGKQYKVEQGSVLKVDHLVQGKGAQVEFPSVLMISDGGTAKIGSPYLSGVSVKAVVEDHGQSRKLVFGKYKKKKNYRRRYGHRQEYSLIKVEGINGIG
jgi:large subunit ribosomal protein L21